MDLRQERKVEETKRRRQQARERAETTRQPGCPLYSVYSRPVSRRVNGEPRVPVVVVSTRKLDYRTPPLVAEARPVAVLSWACEQHNPEMERSERRASGGGGGV